MLIIQHTIISLLTSIALFYSDLNSAILFFLSAVLIDGDHVLSYWYYTKKFSAINYAVIKHWCLTRGAKMNIYLLCHNVWFFGLLFLAALKISFLMPVFFGVCLHYFLDIIWDVHLFNLGKVGRQHRRWLF